MNHPSWSPLDPAPVAGPAEPRDPYEALRKKVDLLADEPFAHVDVASLNRAQRRAREHGRTMTDARIERLGRFLRPTSCWFD